GIFLFGAFALPLHSLSIAHANDRAEPGQFVVISAGLLFFFAIGSTVGPATASVVIEVFGPSAFFAYTSAAHASLLIVSAARLAINSTKPKPDGGRFVRLVRNSPAIVNLAVKAMSRPRPD
ncbi:MAG: MFS transporter, partial [Hyphomicrobiales bacterium]|nr:MFS transporter [Hyphomicrobiales bacterium]